MLTGNDSKTKYYANRAMVAPVSEVLGTAMRNNSKDNQTEINIEARAEILNVILNWIYHEGDLEWFKEIPTLLSINDGKASKWFIELHTAAHRYDIKDLSHACINVLCKFHARTGVTREILDQFVSLNVSFTALAKAVAAELYVTPRVSTIDFWSSGFTNLVLIYSRYDVRIVNYGLQWLDMADADLIRTVCSNTITNLFETMTSTRLVGVLCRAKLQKHNQVLLMPLLAKARELSTGRLFEQELLAAIAVTLT